MKNLYRILCFLLVVTLQNSFAMVADKQSPSFTPAQIKEIQHITHKHLIKILGEASKNLQEQEAKKDNIIKHKKDISTSRFTKKIAHGNPLNIIKHRKDIFVADHPGRIVLGNPNGKIIIAKFTQHQCPSCKKTALALDKLVKDNTEIKLIIIYWPFLGTDAIYTAKAVLAAQKQHKAEELNHAIFAHKDPVTKSNLEPIIKSIKGLNSKQLFIDMKDENLKEGIKDNFKLAKNLDLTGTPVLVFTNKEMKKFSLITGESGNFEKDLAKALKKVN